MSIVSNALARLINSSDAMTRSCPISESRANAELSRQSSGISAISAARADAASSDSDERVVVVVVDTSINSSLSIFLIILFPTAPIGFVFALSDII